jgi:hypothetical protein
VHFFVKGVLFSANPVALLSVALTSSAGPCVTISIAFWVVAASGCRSYLYLLVRLNFRWFRLTLEALVTRACVTLDTPRFSVRLSIDDSSLFFVQAVEALYMCFWLDSRIPQRA